MPASQARLPAARGAEPRGGGAGLPHTRRGPEPECELQTGIPARTRHGQGRSPKWASPARPPPGSAPSPAPFFRRHCLWPAIPRAFRHPTTPPGRRCGGSRRHTPWRPPAAGRWSWASRRRRPRGGCAASSSPARWAGGRRGWAQPGCRGPRSWPARCAAARWPSCCSCTRRCPAAPTPSTAASSSSAVGRRRAAPVCAVRVPRWRPASCWVRISVLPAGAGSQAPTRLRSPRRESRRLLTRTV